MERVDYMRYMERCIELARLGPDSHVMWPYVGAMIVTPQGEVISEGFKRHLAPGLDMHAERDAIEKAGINTRGNFLITTLEPCVKRSHNQLLSSCSDLISSSGIRLVAFGLFDKSPSMRRGAGINYLQTRGIETFYLRGFENKIISELMGARFNTGYTFKRDPEFLGR
ncbi:hypothetical protein KA107_02000 [Candidatus Pacearchaeota archaeon]|nr:hypothetical protein [Candidatus Pacearchaeota archaeon]